MQNTIAKVSQYKHSVDTDDLQDALDNSFSNLEEQDDGFVEDETVNINIEQEQFTQDISDSAAMLVQTVEPVGKKKSKKENGQVQKKKETMYDISQQKKEVTTGKIKSVEDFQCYQRSYVERMKVLYGLAILDSKQIGRIDLKKLKAFLYVPVLAVQLVEWGNNRYGSSHTVSSALERLELIQDSECQHHWIKVKQNMKWVLLLLCGILILRFLL